MALWGISGSDVKNAGWNTAVGIGVAAGCFAVAYGVKKLALYFFDRRVLTPEPEKRENFEKWTNRATCALGLAASYAANAYLPGSRFALIMDNSTAKALKLALIQGFVGLFADSLVHKKPATPIFTVLGIGVALAGRVSAYTVFGLGAVGTVIGSGLIASRYS